MSMYRYMYNVPGGDPPCQQKAIDHKHLVKRTTPQVFSTHAIIVHLFSAVCPRSFFPTRLTPRPRWPGSAHCCWLVLPPPS